MAFRDPNIINQVPTTSPPRPGDGPRTLVAPAVTEGPTTSSTPGAPRPTLAPASALFGGALPKSPKGAEARERQEGDARRFETFHLPYDVVGPLVMPAYTTSGASPVTQFPLEAARAFARIARAEVSP
jgi:hypothetical protein